MYIWGAFVQPLLLWKSNEYYILWVCLCSLRYPACNERALYFHPWPLRLYLTFPHYPINDTIFTKIFPELKIGVFECLYKRKSPILGRIQRDMMNLRRSSYKELVIVNRLKLHPNFIDKRLENIQVYKLPSNASSGSRVVPFRRMDRQTRWS
jgi:hypothetical protein